MALELLQDGRVEQVVDTGDAIRDAEEAVDWLSCNGDKLAHERGYVENVHISRPGRPGLSADFENRDEYSEWLDERGTPSLFDVLSQGGEWRERYDDGTEYLVRQL